MILPAKSLMRHIAQNPLFLILFLPLLVYLVAKQYARAAYYRDPTSQYFDPSRAYAHMYTATRSTEADAFVNASGTQTFKRSAAAAKTPPYLCVGMLTVARPGGYVYFRTSIGSLLEGLTQEERDGIYLMPFITHTDPTKHPVYKEPWLHNVVDRVLVYTEAERLTAEQLDHIKELEAERERSGQPDREKHMFDYGLLMKQCMDVNATYVAIMEDDVLALDGWYHRTRAALKEIEVKESARGLKDFFYLRLFYTEKLLSWDLSEWNALLRYSLVIALLTPPILYLLLRRTAPPLRKHAPLLLVTLTFSLLLGLHFFFTSGAVSMLPIPYGVHKMPKHACCAQGIVYPSTKVPMLTSWYEQNRIGFVDSLAEKLADEKPETTGARWALTPSVLQHIGGKSSKGDNWGSDKPGEMSEAQKLWNFAFELNDARRLEREHSRNAWHEHRGS